jgi:3-phenylpropionate/cinnamic acid dioxygenase small subunit
MSAAAVDAPVQAPPIARLAPPEVQQFLLHEADLLDRREFDAWLALYTPDCTYWVPAEPGDPDPTRRVSLFFDDRSILVDRVWRLGHPRMYSQNPPARQVRVLSPPVLAADDATPARVRTRTKFILFEHRQREQRTFGGTYEHELEPHEGTWRIARKVVRLANCDTVLWNLGVPL